LGIIFKTVSFFHQESSPRYGAIVVLCLSLTTNPFFLIALGSFEPLAQPVVFFIQKSAWNLLISSAFLELLAGLEPAIGVFLKNPVHIGEAKDCLLYDRKYYTKFVEIGRKL